MSKSSGEPGGASGTHSGRDTAERVSLVIASLLVLGVVALVVALWLTMSDTPAQFTVTPGEAREMGDQYYLPVTLTNEGDQTAAQVQIEGTVGEGASEESADTTIDFVPARSEAEVTLVFSQPPDEVELRVVSYQQP